MARNVADVAFMHSAITRGPELSPLDLRGVRIGVPRTPLWGTLDPDIAKIMESALDRLRGAGAEVVDVNIDDLVKTAITVRGALRREDFRNDLADFLAREYPSMTMKDAIPEIPSKRVHFLEEDARDHPPSREDVAKAKATMDALGPRRDAFRQHNIVAIAYPTMPMPAPLLPTDNPTACAIASVAYVRGPSLGTARNRDDAFEIVRILVIGVQSENAMRPVRPAAYFSLLRVREFAV
jgi:indoleacetamide hydrolase